MIIYGSSEVHLAPFYFNFIDRKDIKNFFGNDIMLNLKYIYTCSRPPYKHTTFSGVSNYFSTQKLLQSVLEKIIYILRSRRTRAHMESILKGNYSFSTDSCEELYVLSFTQIES